MKETEVFEGTVLLQGGVQGMKPLVEQSPKDRTLDLAFVLLHRYIGKRVRITIEELPK